MVNLKKGTPRGATDGMRVVIDILTPKQCMFFPKLSEKLEKRGHEVLMLTRTYREVNSLLKLKGVDAKVIGRHGGGRLRDKLEASVERMGEMIPIIEEFKPDVAISFSSPELARVSFGLGIPHICINDSPHAEATARLTIPLSERLLTPKMIPKEVWVRYGIQPDRIIQYYALDPWVWLKDLKPDESILASLNLDRSKPLLTFRMEESFAAYLLGRIRGESPIISIIDRLLKERPELQMVVIPRYREHISTLREAFRGKLGNLKICESIIDGPSLLYYTTIFIGAGGTMSIEAALLGVPAISCYPAGPFLIESFLMNEGLIIRETSPERVVRLILKMLEDPASLRNRQTERARRLTERFEDPLEVIVGVVEGLK
ncbi:lipid-A-disaccharide synthase [Candidatus Bathyarchaeota archaeon]|nr:MAG: lipid-A-disaccharide synthase [Candidatus Bathyarchaeota archaeon]